MDRRVRKRLLRDSNYTIGLGCGNCEDRNICGGLAKPNMISCLDLCCEFPDTCDFVCPEDIQEYVELVNAIGGYNLTDLPRLSSVHDIQVPFYVPLIYHKSRNRLTKLVSDVVALELGQLIDFNSGELKFTSREDVNDRFGIDTEAKLVISGIADDLPLEKYWWSRNEQFISALAAIKPDLVTTPNFSTFANAPRWTDMYNIKRIATCWTEFVRAGIPTALHVNGRTATDWNRWAEFIIERDEVTTIAFEFATILGERKRLYADQLIQLADCAPRKLRLVLRGGTEFLTELSKKFDLVLIDTNPFIKSTKRFKWHPNQGWVSVANPNMTEIDSLLQYNVAALRTELTPLVLNA